MLKSSHALWGNGFRPFFLFGTAYAAILMTLWVLTQTGLGLRLTYFDPITWHAHEMLFGFFGAIISGFLLAASKNWANMPPVGGLRIQLLALVWLAGRFVPFLAAPGNIAAMVVDLALFPLLFAYLVPYLAKKSQMKNWVFLVLIAVMFCANLMVHLDVMGVAPGLSRKGLWLVLNVAVMKIVIMSSRTMPLFVQRGSDGKIKTNKVVEVLSYAGAGGFLLSELFLGKSLVTVGFAVVAGVANGLRWFGWGPWAGLKNRLLWIVFVGYAWLVAGFLLYAVDYFRPLMLNVVLHAFSAGAISIMIFAIGSRLGLGHTGRPIVITNWIAGGYVAISLAAFLRVVPLQIDPGLYRVSILTSGILWALAYGFYAVYYSRFFTQPRVDGKPG